MTNHKWIDNFPGGITVCDCEGIILDMNAKAEQIQNLGRGELIGASLFNCHPESAREQLRVLLENPQPSIYTFEKNGKTVLIYHVPLFESDKFQGFIELFLDIPNQIPHFIR